MGGINKFFGFFGDVNFPFFSRLIFWRYAFSPVIYLATNFWISTAGFVFPNLAIDCQVHRNRVASSCRPWEAGGFIGHDGYPVNVLQS